MDENETKLYDRAKLRFDDGGELNEKELMFLGALDKKFPDLGIKAYFKIGDPIL